DPAPGIAQARIARLGVPNGHAALITLQTQRGVVGRENDTVLYTGLADGNLRIAARGGSSVPGLPNAFFRSIVAFDGNGSTVFFLATLAGKNIHSSNNVALFAALENGSVRLLARKGARLDNSTTTVLSTLVGTQGTLAEGRWRLDDHTIGVRLSFADKTYGLYSIPDDAVQVSDWKCWMKPNFIEDEGELRIPVTPSPIGMPAFSAAGVSYLATIPPTPNLPVRAGGITKANDLLLIHLPVTGKSRILAREGDPVTGLDGKPVDGIVFKSFLDPVEGSTKHVSLPLENNEVCCPACQSPDLLAMRGTNVPVEVVKRHVAFLATLKGTNVGNTNHIGLFTATSMGAARLVARTGSPTPEGGLWNQFVSLVLPNRTDIDALFTATLSDSGDQKVTPENNLGLWVCTNGGAPSLLLRSGQPFFIKNFPKQIRGFVALAPAPGSIGAASGHDDDGHVSVLATFTDGTETLIHIELP
ncbi:MAG: choice-of-anchor tandem repeat NxxGxxAF-containing protein, partial [Verrucomicrobiota bacterium]